MIASEMRDTGDSGPPDTPALEERPSKTQRKREMTQLQALGEALVALSDQRLASLDLPERLRDAVLEAKRITSFGALRRQVQYIGRLMREIDATPIRAQLSVLEGQSSARTAWLHRLERLRERLLDDDDALTSLLAGHPAADAQQLRALIRNARRERALGKPPRAYRELFQALREIVPLPESGGGAVAGAGESGHPSRTR
jgi:ribosome-associated protein